MTRRAPLPAPGPLTLRQEIADWWRFLRAPTLRGRIGPRSQGSGLERDIWPSVRPGRVLAWAALLWVINLFVLGPIAVAAAGAGGAMHRLDPSNLPWLAAIVWAPLVEEMLFRYGLRRPLQALWLVPLMVAVVINGPKTWVIATATALVLLAGWGLRDAPARLRGWNTRWRRFYIRHFFWVFHLSALSFAAVHLSNFKFSAMPWWLMPMLVLPQYLTGLVLGWMRVRRGIGAAVLLHAMFNAGPILLIWALMQWMPEAAT